MFSENHKPHSEEKTGHETKKYDFSNGCTIKANEDMDFLGVGKGDVLEVKFDGQYLRVGPLGWSPEQLTEEINKGVWTFEKKS